MEAPTEYDDLRDWCMNYPLDAADLITKLRSERRRCDVSAPWGLQCDGDAGHDGQHHGHMRDHGDLGPVAYRWGQG